MNKENLQLLDVCQKLHLAKNGGDILSKEQITLYNSFLKSKLKNWKKSICNSDNYDECVKNLCIEALNDSNRILI